MTAPEDHSSFSKQALECLRALGEYVFDNPLESVPWGGRPYALSRRFILQKYLTNADILQAFWVQEQAKRTDTNWFWKEPGLTHLASLMSERSGDQWRQEQQAYQLASYTPMDYMREEFGPIQHRARIEQRNTEAQRRRAAFQVIHQP